MEFFSAHGLVCYNAIYPYDTVLPIITHNAVAQLQ